MYRLEAKGLSKEYNGNNALKNLNLQIEKGEVFCLPGQNGAGKTTTINLFLGFIPASSGEARINGIIVNPAHNATKKFVAYIPETVMFYGNLSGLESL